MQIVTRYRCDECGKLMCSEKECLEHEARHKMIYKANEMLENGKTLKEINDETHIWKYGVPDYLLDVTGDNCFKVPYWQCCEKPAYKITDINFDGMVRLWGCGSWSGYYGDYVGLSFDHLKNPRPNEELFIDKRYGRL